MPMVPQAVKEELLRKPRNELTVSYLVSKISNTTKIQKDDKGHRKFDISTPEWDIRGKIHLKAGEYINTTDVDTTLGQLLLNRLLIEDYIEIAFDNHYCNDVMDKKAFGKIMDRLAVMLMENKIQLNPNVVKFLQAFEFYGLMLCSALSPSFSPGVFSVNDEIRKRRDELFAKYGDNPSTVETIKIEDELTKEAHKLLKDDPGMTLFDSGSRGSFDDNYKMMSIMVGPVKNMATGNFDVVKNNYFDGIDRRDIPAIANTMVNGPYAKAVGTAEGGYLTKQFYAVYQSIAIDEHGTDCGSKGYMPVFLTPQNYGKYMWQYVVDGGRTVLLTDDNKSKYVNHAVKLRSPIGCLGKKLCNKCMGERFYKLTIENVGLTTSRLPNSIMNDSLKNFHKTKMSLATVDPDKLLID